MCDIESKIKNIMSSLFSISTDEITIETTSANYEMMSSLKHLKDVFTQQTISN